MKKRKSLLILLLTLILFGCAVNSAVPIDDDTDDDQAVPTESRAQQILDQMTIEEKIGQMFLVRCNSDTALDDIAAYHVGGFILYGENVEDLTADELRDMIAGYQAAADIGLLIAVDEEGGVVNRLSIYSQYRDEAFASAQDLYAEGGWDAIVSDTETKCAFLKDLGFNVNMAPVADVADDEDAYIYDRTFGQDAALTSEYVTEVVTVMKQQQVGSVLKHFPGYGDNGDTHAGIVTDDRSYASFEATDFLPFIAGIEAGADAILVSHNIVTCMDDTAPASLSKAVHDILRNELHFEGVIMSDDLKMEAIREAYGDEQAAVDAVLAGNDIIISTYYDVQIPAVIQAYQNGTITEEQINASVLRILNWKLSLGIIE